MVVWAPSNLLWRETCFQIRNAPLSWFNFRLLPWEMINRTHDDTLTKTFYAVIGPSHIWFSATIISTQTARMHIWYHKKWSHAFAGRPHGCIGSMSYMTLKVQCMQDREALHEESVLLIHLPLHCVQERHAELYIFWVCAFVDWVDVKFLKKVLFW